MMRKRVTFLVPVIFIALHDFCAAQTFLGPVIPGAIPQTGAAGVVASSDPFDVDSKLLNTAPKIGTACNYHHAWTNKVHSSSASTIAPCIETFVATFRNAVYASEVLSDVFDLSQTTAKAIAKSFYDQARQHSLDIGVLDPNLLANNVAQPITENFNILTLPVMVNIFANAAAKYLFAECILNRRNAEQLALDYASVIEANAKHLVEKNNPESKCRALGDGFTDFWRSNGLLTSDKAPNIAVYFGNEVRLQGKQFGKSTALLQWG